MKTYQVTLSKTWGVVADTKEEAYEKVVNECSNDPDTLSPHNMTLDYEEIPLVKSLIDIP